MEYNDCNIDENVKSLEVSEESDVLEDRSSSSSSSSRHISSRSGDIDQTNNSIDTEQSVNNQMSGVIIPIQFQQHLTYSILYQSGSSSEIYVDTLYYRYYKYFNQNNLIYLVCENQTNQLNNCSVLACVSANTNENWIKINGCHNHQPRQEDVNNINLRNILNPQTLNVEPLRTQLNHQENLSFVNTESTSNCSILNSQLCMRTHSRQLHPVQPINNQNYPNFLGHVENISNESSQQNSFLNTENNTQFHQLVNNRAFVSGQFLHSQQVITYTISPDIHLNTEVIVDNVGHKYFKYYKQYSTVYLVCENSRNSVCYCPVLACINENIFDNTIQVFGQHNHPSQDEIIARTVHLRRTLSLPGYSNPPPYPVHLYNRNVSYGSSNISRNSSIQPSQLCIRSRSCRFHQSPIRPVVTNNFPNFLGGAENTINETVLHNSFSVNTMNSVVSNQLEVAQIAVNEINHTYSVLFDTSLNVQVFVDNLNYKYLKQSCQNNFIYLLCEHHNMAEHCPVVACISVDMSENWIKINRSHNHLPRPAH